MSLVILCSSLIIDDKKNSGGEVNCGKVNLKFL